MKWLALDIGGANLKIADGRLFAESHAFPLWRDAKKLSQQLRMLITQSPTSSHLAVTMSGELADCFETKSAGVSYILKAVEEAADGRHVRVYLTDGRLIAPQFARDNPLLAAASNWHALASFVGRIAERGTGLLIDIGSTTTDIIPLLDGKPVAIGKTDTDRLLSGELVYTGVERSPVCALIDSTSLRGQQCPIAQELFATTGDIYVIRSDLPETPARKNTADGRPATKRAARTRLSRMVCADDENFNHKDAVAIAHTVADAQLFLISAAVKKVISTLPREPENVILSGHGEFLAKRVVQNLGMSANFSVLSKLLGVSVSRCAPAHALAVLANEGIGA